MPFAAGDCRRQSTVLAPGLHNVAWYADDPDERLASIRLRMLQPMRALLRLGLRVSQYDPGVGPGAYDTLVFSKALSPAALQLAREARQLGRRVIYDLCDNLHESRPGRRRARRVALLEQFLTLADLVVFSTPALQRQMLERHPRLASASLVIPDELEQLGCGPGATDLSGRWHLARLHRFLQRHRQALHCVWFGKSQGGLAGLQHLHSAVRELAIFARSHAVTLTVISNRWSRYLRASSNWQVPHCYLPWSPATFVPALQAHKVAVIPLTSNGYTAGKSINRPATAILAQLGVVADCIESYEELRPFVMLDRWQEGLRYYADNDPVHDPRLAAARAHLEARYGSQHVARLWKAALEGVPFLQAVA